MREKQSGFTLIELIIVIVILGVLSVVAVPRFIDLGRDAKIAVLEKVKSDIQFIRTQVRIKCEISPTCNPNDASSTVLIPSLHSTRPVLVYYGDPASRSGVGWVGLWDIYAIGEGIERHTDANWLVYFMPNTSNCYVRYEPRWVHNPQAILEVTSSGC